MPSSPLDLIAFTADAMVVAPCARPAHMCGVPALKSWRMIVSTTFTPRECAAASRPLSSLEFHTVRPESLTKLPSAWTCSPK